MKEIYLWNFIHEKLSKNIPVMLIAVVDHEKGSPGKRGFKMVLSKDGGSVGSVGGGIMEYNIVNDSINFFKKKTRVNKIEKLYHSRKKTVNRSGLICAGSQTNFTISLKQKDIEKVKIILESLQSNSPGKIIFNQDGISFIKKVMGDNEMLFEYKNENEWKYEQFTGIENILFVIGGGHVGLAVSKLMSMLDFYIIVYDSRQDLQTIEKNKYANEKIISPFKDLGKYIKNPARTFIVIVTTGFESDKDALKQVINKNVRYIGIMGTRAKIKKIMNEAIREGIKKQLLNQVHAPIGIGINSDTPEEIAVSIAAEIIKVKNEKYL